ncbi:restriction endonuclease [Streptacidiphilus sp. EB129]|uniref:restriction endonuclease n=1 Tax=Streptacidiphilus sp. EB129 TaxID=3156262 RepID=UPI0035174006
MGGIRSSGRAVVEAVIELVGAKSGLAITERDLIRALEKVHCIAFYPGMSLEPQRIRAEAVQVLYFGALEVFCEPGALRLISALGHAVPQRLDGNHELAERAIAFVKLCLRDQGLGTIMESVWDRFPHRPVGCGSELEAAVVAAVEIVNDPELAMAAKIVLEESLLREKHSNWTFPQQSEWVDAVQLAELFKSDSAVAEYGRFFDQRFINFLANNFEVIGSIHWRKFEALVAEYFHRSGFQVELGPGGNDNGVDIRVWESGQGQSGAPTLIVQCKRERRKIAKVVVKALAADVRWEGAQAGMLVATADWSPGAREVVVTRKYPVHEVNPPILRNWLEDMRKAGRGPWLAG